MPIESSRSFSHLLLYRFYFLLAFAVWTGIGTLYLRKDFLAENSTEKEILAVIALRSVISQIQMKKHWWV